ncbi:dienelactone hydrolase family protein, partial [Thermodesulfobacteriota bacterium]
MQRLLTFFLLFLFWPGTAFGEVVGKPVTYTAGDTQMNGFLAYNDSITTKRPGILVIHECWGHNEYARKRARMLAELGYTALAVDMYGGGKQAHHPADASQFAAEVRQNLPVAKRRFEAALKVLQKHATVDPQHIAAIGYCFGGGMALQMARLGLDLDAVVSFHGSLATDTPVKPDSIKARILICDGADDKLVTPEQIQVFLREMKSA